MPRKSFLNNLSSISLKMSANVKLSLAGSVKTDVLCPGPIALLLSLLVLLVLPGSVAGAGPGPGAGPPPMVTVAPVSKQDINPATEYVGHVEAIQTVDLRARVEGFLEQVKFKEGGYVHSGDILYIIEQAPYLAKVDAEKARVGEARAALTKARQYLDRIRTVSTGGVSATDLDNAVAEELRTRAQLEQAKANLQIARINLNYTAIAAPISGRIGSTAFTRGNLVNPGSGPLAQIVQIDPIRVVFSISENDLVAIKAAIKDTDKNKKHPLLTPRIKLSGGQILKTEGRIDFVNNTVDASTGTIAVRAVFKNPDGMLLPGQYVTILISRNERKSMLLVPQAAVMQDCDGRYVLLVNDKNQVAIRRIQTGPMVGINWAVESGLTVNDRVIVEGVQKVRPGQQVKITVADQ